MDTQNLNDEDLLKDLSIGSLEMDPLKDRNPLVDRTYRTTLKLLLSPLENGLETANKK